MRISWCCFFLEGNRDLNFASDQREATPDEKTGTFEIKDVTPVEYVATAISFAGAKSRITTQNVNVVVTDIDGRLIGFDARN
jgi:hypothetical protein